MLNYLSNTPLAVLSNFFNLPEFNLIVIKEENWKGYIFNEIGADLRSLGRLEESVRLFQASLDVIISREDWMRAAIRASNLSELYLTLGDTTQALAYAEQGMTSLTAVAIGHLNRPIAQRMPVHYTKRGIWQKQKRFFVKQKRYKRKTSHSYHCSTL